MPWTQDVEVESTPLDTTGGQTWKAAYRLAAFLGSIAAELQRPGIKLLELGAGTGWLGLTVARNLPADAFVCLTEQDAGLDWLRHNLELNRSRGLPLENVAVQPCDWTHYAAAAPGGSGCGGSSGGQPPPAGQQDAAASASCQGNADQVVEADSTAAAAAAAAAEGLGGTGGGDAPPPPLDLRSVAWDYIFGSDLVYNEAGSRCLPRVLASLARPPGSGTSGDSGGSGMGGRGVGGSGSGGTRILYCHTKHRLDLLDLEFFENLEAAGLHCREVWEAGAPPPPHSPPLRFPPADLFPEQRIAVYLITPAGPAAPAAGTAGGRMD